MHNYGGTEIRIILNPAKDEFPELMKKLEQRSQVKDQEKEQLGLVNRPEIEEPKNDIDRALQNGEDFPPFVGGSSNEESLLLEMARDIRDSLTPEQVSRFINFLVGTDEIRGGAIEELQPRDLEII